MILSAPNANANLSIQEIETTWNGMGDVTDCYFFQSINAMLT
jgi:hypothetical protein